MLNMQIAAMPTWKVTHRVVTSVRQCSHFSVYATNATGGSLRLEADSGVLSKFLGGASSVSSQVSVSGASGLNLTGTDGAISVGAHRRALCGAIT